MSGSLPPYHKAIVDESRSNAARNDVRIGEVVSAGGEGPHKRVRLGNQAEGKNIVHTAK